MAENNWFHFSVPVCILGYNYRRKIWGRVCMCTLIETIENVYIPVWIPQCSDLIIEVIITYWLNQTEFPCVFLSQTKIFNAIVCSVGHCTAGTFHSVIRSSVHVCSAARLNGKTCATAQQSVCVCVCVCSVVTHLCQCRDAGHGE